SCAGQGIAWDPPRRSRQGADALSIFSAITFVVAFVLSAALYPLLIRALRRWKSGQVIQAELPESHQLKAGTPTGGGILFVALGIVAGVLATIAGHVGALPA